MITERIEALIRINNNIFLDFRGRLVRDENQGVVYWNTEDVKGEFASDLNQYPSPLLFYDFMKNYHIIDNRASKEKSENDVHESRINIGEF